MNNSLRWRKQSYLKQRLQKSVWKECRLCSLCTDLAFGPSMLGVHSGGRAPGSCCSVSSLYLQKRQRFSNHDHHQISTQMEVYQNHWKPLFRSCFLTYFSLSSSTEPLSGNMEEMASKILSEGNFFVSLLWPVAYNKKAQKRYKTK